MNSFLHHCFFSVEQSLIQLKQNTSRSILSVMGISFGIFCISGVFIAITSLQKNIQNEINSLGNNIFFIDKWEYDPQTKIPRWKIAQRPNVTYDEVEFLRKNITEAKNIGIAARANMNIKTNEKQENADVLAIDKGYRYTQNFEIELGRNFTDEELDNGAQVCVLDNTLAKEINSNLNQCLNNRLFINGRILQVIGILKESKNKILKYENGAVFLPYQYGKDFVTGRAYGLAIAAQPKIGVDENRFRTTLQTFMRQKRQLDFNEEDNFALNSLQGFSRAIDNVFKRFTTAGLIIGSIGLIVGLFGIANIMFVSVAERKSIIGLKKAIGAKPNLIVLEFLTESVILSIIGSIIGFLMSTIVAVLFEKLFKFPIYINWITLLAIILLSVLFGIIAGYLPALKASKLSAVESLRG